MTDNFKRGSRLGSARQKGNALVFAMLGLVITGLIAAANLEPTRAAQKAQAGFVEATILQSLRNATNEAIYENVAALQAGNPFIKAGVTVAPVTVAGQLVWRPSIADLTAMGYLSTGWTTTSSAINEAPYSIEFARTPAGCVAAACAIQGRVLITAPILADGQAGTTDGAIIGSILTTIGSDSGVSLLTGPANITGYGNTWLAPNPVAGAPAGVVAVLVGTGTAGVSQYVRIGDTRDPNLGGNLTVAGDTSIAGNLSVGGTSTFTGPMTLGPTTINNATFQVLDGTGTPCVSIQPTGVISIACAGVLNAVTGTFADALGNRSVVDPNGLVTTGFVSAIGGFAGSGGAVTAFTPADQSGIAVNAGDFYVRNAAGTRLLRANANGDVIAARGVAGQVLGVSRVVVQGQACIPTEIDGGGYTQYATTPDGSMAVCDPTTSLWSVLSVRSVANTACPVDGAIATDRVTNKGLVCMHGFYVSADSALSNMVMGVPFAITGNGMSVVKSTVINCAAQGGGTGYPLVYILAQTEASTDAAFTRYASDSAQGTNAGSWTFTMLDGKNNPLTSVSAIGIPYCYY